MSEEPGNGGAADTPMMRQYLELKAQVPDALLMYRMGDFYELFFEDARIAADILDLTLTSRNKKDPDPIPMAGLPWHALEAYLPRLVEAGRKVAIAEQREVPGQKMMSRELVRVITPGIPWEADGVEARERSWVVGACGREPVGLAFLDVTTGELRVTEVGDVAAAAAEISRMEPREAVIAPGLDLEPAMAAILHGLPTSAPGEAWFDPKAARRCLTTHFGTADLLGFGAGELGPALAAAGALLSYAREVARINLDMVQQLTPYQSSGHMALDEATRRNLELVRPLRGTGRKGTLLGLLDRTMSPMGGRLLRDWLVSPLTELARIQGRHAAVEALLPGGRRRAIREALGPVADLERLGSKVAQGRANARDLVALATSLSALPALVEEIGGLPAFVGRVPQDLLPEVGEEITGWLVDEPPASLLEGGLIRRGRHADLDEITSLAMEGKGAIARMEARLRTETGINSLKVRHNSVFGYFIEITQANMDRAPSSWIRKQTLATCERYITPELKEFEEKVLGAEQRRKSLEYELFSALRDRVSDSLPRLQILARQVAWVDAIAALAEVAVDRRFVRPTMDLGPRLSLQGARHPVVEAMALEERFVPNDLELDEQRRLVILTGPNMAGKSTVMRQVALIVLMAQAGGFVPADAAHIGLCDRIFVRVGASDDLAQGRSTFMVEMSETALILNSATSRSLILLDEIGRGTSTYDGMAIAWAVAEAVHDRLRARAIFATHYHELVGLAEELERVSNLHVAVSESGDKIVFLRALRPGGASKSYGIQCARLAGMPPEVIARARALLTDLERHPRHAPERRQLSLFERPAPPPEPPPAADPLREAVAALDPDALSPREALVALYQLKALAGAP